MHCSDKKASAIIIKAGDVCASSERLLIRESERARPPPSAWKSSIKKSRVLMVVSHLFSPSPFLRFPSHHLFLPPFIFIFISTSPSLLPGALTRDSRCFRTEELVANSGRRSTCGGACCCTFPRPPTALLPTLSVDPGAAIRSRYFLQHVTSK